MKNTLELENIYQAVYKEIESLLQRPDGELYISDATVMLTYMHHKKQGSLNAYTDFERHLEKMAEMSILMPRKYFCNGKASLDWVFSFLKKEEVIDENDWRYLRSSDEEQALIAIHQLRMGNYDLLHGAVGIAYCLLNDRGTELMDFFSEFFAELERQCNASACGMIENYDLMNGFVKRNEVNLGLSHGIPSILKFSLESYRRGVCTSEARKLAERIIAYLLKYSHEGGEFGFFPAVVKDDKPMDTPTQLAWCYGDLGVGYILYQAGELFQDAPLKDFALRVLKGTTPWTNHHHTTIHDACICHGTTGAAYIYHKLNKMTELPEFLEARDRWLRATVDCAHATSADHIYESYNSRENIFQPDHSMLNGTAGIGLALNSMLSDEYDWDYLLMLN